METATTRPNTPSHGLKRSADDNLESEQRLSKRFDLLNLDRSSKLWTPPPGHRPPPMRRHSNDAPQYMDVEDTRHKIHIHDLDRELEEISKDSEREAKDRLIFLPDIEKHFNKLPAQVMRAGEDHCEPQRSELVLYGVPTSLSVPEEKDSVRKAIIEARARARDKAITFPTASQDALLHDVDESGGGNVDRTLQTHIHSQDAMDID